MNTLHNKSDLLFELAEILNQQSDFSEILRLVSSRTAAIFAADAAAIVMTNPHTQDTVRTIIREGSQVDEQMCSLVQTNVVGWIIKNKLPFFSKNIMTDGRFDEYLRENFSPQSVMCVPLTSQTEKIGYLFVMQQNSKNLFDDHDFSAFKKMAMIVSPFLFNTQKIEEYFKEPLSEKTLLKKYEAIGLLGKSKAFTELLQAIEAAARCDVRVMLEGKSGTGKEVIAESIHKFGARSGQPFIAIDCGAIPEHLIESELFGYVKGAFTGASQDRKGLMVEADNGTLFMDEIANLPYEMQAKLLRVLQSGEVRPVGSNKSQKINVRIITASSSPLRELVTKKKFREDLYYRLYVYPISVPTLNQRDADIPLLTRHFLQQVARQQNKAIKSCNRSLLSFMQQRNWPGNIRELENFVERLVTLASPETSILDPAILPNEFQSEYENFAQKKTYQTNAKSLQTQMDEVEERIIRQVLEENDWNQSHAARILTISERTIRYKMKRMGIVKPNSPKDSTSN
jgi:transcriptional regulator with GAF, ATPase, and Fis domain